ncbi:MAG: sugar ABC transporter permease [Clostridiales bacterium]|nr:sugar ABC transporter permease [Clostridiales bacterium]
MDYKAKITAKGYLFIMPYLVGMLIFYLIPYIISIAMSFTSGVGQKTYVGLKNYVSLFQSDSFLLASKNTLFFTFTAIPLLFVIALLLALYLNDKLQNIRIFRSVFILPLVLPTASVILFWQIIFKDKGLVNHALNILGIDSIRFFNSEYSMLIIILIFIWKYVGYSVVLFLSGLNSISSEFYENAQIDGASNWQCFKSITLPLLKPMSFLVLILSFVNSLRIFREVYLLSGAYPHENIYMLQHFMSNNMSNLNYQRLTTASFILSIIIVTIMIILYRYERKTDVV